ncbi:helix-turn-helix domain-containing protein [Nocardia macrotermitis]|uniref:HTH cro/C1-type domain-containing protein n=1 Tax=Nocardia macrotermitis TaxID=2585198 RepID=A0A7K0CYH2_9NOCA|nr:helix-turn-helix transcriptional regulator [Nocardia macrotermitis]MQY17704.1 hypothetical protein [Nocardia macrotermitis]
MTAAPPRVGPLLREWRNRRRLSQLELALAADSSARHISFIETGRSRPSREMVLRLADQLDVPVRERNTLLIAAGYAPDFPETSLQDPRLRELRTDLERLVGAHEPFPALILDGGYDVVAANRGVRLMLSGVDPELLESPNAMRLTLHPRGMAPRIRNYSQWRAHLLHQMQRQLALTRSTPLRALYDEVEAYPPPRHCGAELAPITAAPALPLLLEIDGRTLAFISLIATFNTPTDITVSELALETFLPADPETTAFLTAQQHS